MVIACLVYLQHSSPSDARALSSQLPTTPFEQSRPGSFRVADNLARPGSGPTAAVLVNTCNHA